MLDHNSYCTFPLRFANVGTCNVMSENKTQIIALNRTRGADDTDVDIKSRDTGRLHHHVILNNVGVIT